MAADYPQEEKPILSPSQDVQRHFSIEAGTEIAPRWMVLKQLPMILELDEDGTYVVSDEIFYRYGAGEDFKEAMSDFALNITTYYAIMEKDANEDYPATLALFRHLQEFIRYENA